MAWLVSDACQPLQDSAALPSCGRAPSWIWLETSSGRPGSVPPSKLWDSRAELPRRASRALQGDLTRPP
eukprot:scaffold85685_cov66-Phaeocystis_antarctica.AAC.2